MSDLQLGMITWRRDAAIHVMIEGSNVTQCGKVNPDGLLWIPTGKAEPTCRSCKRYFSKLKREHPLNQQ